MEKYLLLLVCDIQTFVARVWK